MKNENLQVVAATEEKQQWITPTINDWEIKDVTLSGVATPTGTWDGIAYS